MDFQVCQPQKTRVLCHLKTTGDVQQQYLENGSSTHRHFITKLMLITARSYTTTQRLHSYKFALVDKLFSALPCLPSCCPLRRTPFSNVVRMRTRSLVPKPKTTVIGLGVRLGLTRSAAQREVPCTESGWPFIRF